MILGTRGHVCRGAPEVSVVTMPPTRALPTTHTHITIIIITRIPLLSPPSFQAAIYTHTHILPQATALATTYPTKQFGAPGS